MCKRYLVTAITMLLLTPGIAIGDQGEGKTGEEIKEKRPIPSMLHSQVIAMGKKLKDKDKERTVFEGLLIDAEGTEKPARISVQKNRKVKLEGFKRDKIAFDGEKAKNAVSRKDKAFLETYLYDTAEGMFEALQTDASFRLLGSRFGPDPAKNPNYNGPRYDVYDLTMPNKLAEDGSLRNKLYYFDSETHLLYRTVYRDLSVKPLVTVETRFSSWGTIDGSAYPARVDRYENGKRIFSFIATEIESGQGVDIENYQ